MKGRLVTVRKVKLGGCILSETVAVRQKRRGCWPLWGVRRTEVERLIVERHGGVCDTEDGGLYLYLVAHTICTGKKSANKEQLVRWAQYWVPQIGNEERDSIIAQALRRPSEPLLSRRIRR